MKKDLTIAFGLNILSFFISLLLTSFLSKNLRVEDFGKYQLIITFIGIIGVFSLTGMNIVINKMIINNNEQLFYPIFKSSYKLILFFFVILLTVLLSLYFFFRFERILFFVIASLFLPILGMERYEPVFNAKQKFIYIRILFLINIILHFVLCFIFFSYSNSYYSVIISYFICKLLIDSIGLKKAFSLVKKEKSIPYKDNFKEGLKLSALGFYNILIGYLDKIILGFIDYKLLAIYSIGIMIPIKAKDQLKMIAGIMSQKWAKEGQEYYVAQTNKYIVIVFLLSSTCAFFLSIASKIYVPIFFGNNYSESYKIIWIVSIAIPFLISGSFLSNNIILFQDLKIYRIQIISRQILYIILLFILSKLYNIVGIALSFLFRAIYDFCFTLYFYRKNIKHRGLKDIK